MSHNSDIPVVFKDQTLLTIELDTFDNMEGSSVTEILFKKPNKTKGKWTAEKQGTKLRYVIQPGNIDVYGTWEFQAYAEINGKVIFGEIAEYKFSPNLLNS